MPPPPHAERPPVDLRALEAALRGAGRIALAGFRRVAPEIKDDGSVVTQADRDAEDHLRAALEALLPGVPFLGEESPPPPGDDGWLWAVDPIDGTQGYATGFSYFCNVIGLMLGGRPVLGAVLLPALGPAGDLYLGGQGVPASRNGVPIEVVRPDSKVAPAFFAPSDVHRRKGFRFPGKIRCVASTAAHVTLVADGGAVGALVTWAYLWDVAGPLAILEAAGGAACHDDGSPLDLAALRGGEPLPRPALAGPAWALDSLRASLGDVTRGAPAQAAEDDADR